MKPKKWIFFDIGGVLIRDFSGTDSWEVLLKRLEVDEKNVDEFNRIWSSHEQRICIDYDVDTMLDELHRAGIGLDVESMLDIFIDLFTKNNAILYLLDATKDAYNFGVITNMYPRMLDAIYKKGIYPSEYNWKILIDSSEEKLQKPDQAIFQLALHRAGIEAEDAIFIDNSREHVDAARMIGIKSFQYDVSRPEHSAKEILAGLDGRKT